jgi:hypothetical protein
MMHSRGKPATSALSSACALLVASCALGCDGPNEAGRFVPPEDVAQDALAAVLTAWQRGDAASLALDDKTAIQAVDQHRRPGQTLEAFEIVGEVAGDGGRWFEVELRLDDPPATEQVRYVVVGVNPLWVFRQIDYELLSHWDHPMPEDAADP